MPLNPKDLLIESFPVIPYGTMQCGLMPKGVRVTHLPTGISALCNSERSQQLNMKVALSMIEWGLTEIQNPNV